MFAYGQRKSPKGDPDMDYQQAPQGRFEGEKRAKGAAPTGAPQ
jgi:hypothetical protein